MTKSDLKFDVMVSFNSCKLALMLCFFINLLLLFFKKSTPVVDQKCDTAKTMCLWLSGNPFDDCNCVLTDSGKMGSPILLAFASHVVLP